MSFGSYSTTPASNTSINGININTGCPAGNLDNAIRQLAADGAELHATVTAISVSDYAALAGAAFTGSITRSGAGSYLYHNSASLVGGAIYTQLVATALPSSPAEGTIVLQY